MAECRDALY